jgi:mRNA interferase RelE/StbE
MKHSELSSKKKANFKLTITEKAKKEIRKLPVSDIKKIDSKIQSLQANPYAPDSRKLAGSLKTYRIRQGDYRIIYEVDDHAISIMRVGHRRDIYR